MTEGISTIEKIKEYKELLESGVISQEEFETKKKELLNSSDKTINNENIVDTIAKPKTMGIILMITAGLAAILPLAITVIIIPLVTGFGFYHIDKIIKK